MADIKCRCGEPWDSTGGLHHSHSDMPWWEYQELIQGCGCPSCHGDFKESRERDLAWQRSVQFLADGSITGDPYPEWPAPMWPRYCVSAEGVKKYRGHDDDPWMTLIPAGLRIHFKDDDCQLSDHPEKVDMEEPKQLSLKPDEQSMKWAGIWVPLLKEKICDDDGAPLLERCNAKALEARLRDPETGVQHWFVDTEGTFWIGVCYIRYDKVTTFEKAIRFTDDIHHELEAHPMLDEDAYHAEEDRLKQEAMEEVLGDINLAEWAGMSEEVFKAYLGTRTDAIQAEIELDKWGKVDWQPDNAFFRRLLAPVSEPQHHEILRSVVNPECLLLRQKPWENLMPYNRQEPELCMGILIFDAKQGPRASPEVAPSTTVPLHEFTKGTMLNYVKWSELGFKFQACILDLIIGEDPDATWNWEFWSGEHA